MLDAPYPEIDDLLTMMGEAGRHMAEIGASEGAAGNISICLNWPVELRHHFPVVDTINLPQDVPELAGATILVSGSGRRLREIKDDPLENVACITIEDGGQAGKLFTSHRRRFKRVTSEFNSHLIK
jgi:rhamnulose-1-phosphate aldolase